MKKTTTQFTVIVVCLLGVLLGGIARLVKAYTSDSRTPMTIQTLGRTYGPDGQQKIVALSMESVRADGAVMQEDYTSGYMEFQPFRSIYLPREKRALYYDPESKATTTHALADKIASALTAPLKDCLSANPKPAAACVPTDEKVLGFPVWKLTSSFQAGSNKWDTVDWIAPDLDWKVLKHLAYVDGVLQSGREVVSITLGQPAPALFEAPAGATAKGKFSEFLTAVNSARGLGVTDTIRRMQDRERAEGK